MRLLLQKEAPIFKSKFKNKNCGGQLFSKIANHMAKERRISREFALQVLFAVTLAGLDFKADREKVEDLLDHFQQEFAIGIKSDFARRIVFGVLEHREQIDADLQSLAAKWPLEKLSQVERCTMEIAGWEILFEKQTPLAVILDEAIEIAKNFGDDTAGKFVNGVLSAFAEKHGRRKGQ